MRIPKHIGIIPDGNRRWALSQQMEKKDGYQYGLEPEMKLLKKAKEYGVEELTYYGFTTDNCKRPKEQFDAFQSACVEAVEMLTQEGRYAQAVRFSSDAVGLCGFLCGGTSLAGLFGCGF